MFLASFNVYFLFGYACFMRICLKTAICFSWDKVCFFGEGRLATLAWTPLEFGETSSSACNDDLPHKQPLR